MKIHMKIKLLFLAGIIALTVLLGTLEMANKVQAGNPMQLAGPCWKCGG
jgi:hypothetical protein